MSRCRSLAAALALFAALAVAGCGLGPGEEVGEASLTITREFGAEQVAEPVSTSVSESDTVMRLLEREADLSTRYGGGFVSSIDGIAETVRDGRRFDWFFYVDGVESPVGAADYDLAGGEAVWWDYRAWKGASRVPAVVGSFPSPLLGGYDGRERPVALECDGERRACDLARERLEEAGVSIAAGSPEDAIRVLVGPWGRLREDPTASLIERGPQTSGVFAEFLAIAGRTLLLGLNRDGEVGRRFGPGAGLVAATRRFEAPPVWIVSGTTPAGVRAAAAALDPDVLRDRFAVVAEAGEVTALPVP